MDKNFSQRLKELIGGGEVRPFARKCGMTEATIRNYLKGSDPRLPMVIQIAEACGVSVGWLAAGESPAKNGEIAATIGPGDQAKKTRLMLLGEKASRRNIHLRQIIEWMDQEFGEHEEQALFFYEDLKARYPSFARFMEGQAEKKRPRDHHQVAEPEKEYNNSKQ